MSGTNEHLAPRPLGFHRRPESWMLGRAMDLEAELDQRRSVRQFSDEDVPRELIERAITIASSAPSGAHIQPWTFAVISDPTLKARLRDAAEVEERAFYAERATPAWLEALAPLGTDKVKKHLTTAPWVIVLFRHRYEITASGERRKNYYSTESCGIAAGFLISALHQIGLCTLPHTPSPMTFLSELLGRPDNEQAFLVLPVGFPADNCHVPDIARKPLADVAVWH